MKTPTVQLTDIQWNEVHKALLYLLEPKFEPSGLNYRVLSAVVDRLEEQLEIEE